MITPFLEALSWLFAAVLWWMFYGPIRKYQCDRARYRLFVIRDNLFEVAARGSDLKFEDRAYGMARTTLNGMLHNVEDFTVVRLLLLLWRVSHDVHWRSECAHHSREFKRATDELSPEGRRLIHEAMGAAHRVMLVYLLRRSLTLLMLREAGRLLRPIGGWIGRIRHSRHIKVAMSYDSNIAGYDEIGYRAAT